MGGSDASKSSFGGSSMASSRFSVGKLTKYELKKRFYEKLEDFKGKVLLHRELGMAVYRARCGYSGAILVLKGYSKEEMNQQSQQRVWNEVQILQNAQCPFMTKCFDAFEDQGWWWLVLENSACGDLYSILNNLGAIQEEGWLVTQVLQPLLQTLAYLHKEGIMHRDLKPEHVLFNAEKVIKLAGFFYAIDVTRVGYPKDLVGDLDYMAPEVFILNNTEGLFKERIKSVYPEGSTTYDYEVDIWRLGCLVYEVLTGNPPFYDEDPDRSIERILFEDLEVPSHLSEEAEDFILLALSKVAEERPTAKELLSHPWIQNFMDWEAPRGFEDPIPAVDFTYYQKVYDGLNGVDEDDTDSMDDWIRSQPKWYDPRSWFRSSDKTLQQDGEEIGASGVGSTRRPMLGVQDNLLKPSSSLPLGSGGIKKGSLGSYGVTDSTSAFTSVMKKLKPPSDKSSDDIDSESPVGCGSGGGHAHRLGGGSLLGSSNQVVPAPSSGDLVLTMEGHGERHAQGGHPHIRLTPPLNPDGYIRSAAPAAEHDLERQMSAAEVMSDVSSTGLSETLANALNLTAGTGAGDAGTPAGVSSIRVAPGATKDVGLNYNTQNVVPAGGHLIPDPRANSPLLLAGLRGGACYEEEDHDVQEIMHMVSGGAPRVSSTSVMTTSRPCVVVVEGTAWSHAGGHSATTDGSLLTSSNTSSATTSAAASIKASLSQQVNHFPPQPPSQTNPSPFQLRMTPSPLLVVEESSPAPATSILVVPSPPPGLPHAPQHPLLSPFSKQSQGSGSAIAVVSNSSADGLTSAEENRRSSPQQPSMAPGAGQGPLPPAHPLPPSHGLSSSQQRQRTSNVNQQAGTVALTTAETAN
ncbi:hypothetical protein CEUSTIGMA_g9355.t1 [Chlamydomonas eustigma]|uniref:Protein kinase domain-containing protein n=1 Tax=Chlamydomonas eustigma TaxID=1157962 RepID=A0A250XFT2_9CHLO|nr:hypothetical protein CEUSTIGMA_g9355.t1 [Chlamydomonas eustigma]|eukprot:GAX81927.1 hypothetical protein CEUSTIGMA_g9355.t1 [Chlamydomonas eustigma]